MINKKVASQYDFHKLVKLSKRELMMTFRSSENGLSKADADTRLEEYGPNIVATEQPVPLWKLLINATKDPFVYVLILLLVISALTKDYDAVIIMGIMIFASVFIQFVQDVRAQKASFELKEMIENTCAVTREGETYEIPMDEVVPGDIVRLATGDMIPADGKLIWANDLFVNQSSLTGESLPVEKYALVDEKKRAVIQENQTVLEMSDLVFMGTDVLSGEGIVLIMQTGGNTFFGDIAKTASSTRESSAFEKGITQVSKLLLRLVAVFFIVVLLLNGLLKGDWSQAFFFAIAVAVGLTPEMLPMIVTSNLAKGALALSKKEIIVKELNAIQNLGGMDVLCTDKTGTITEDKVVLVEYVNPEGKADESVLDAAYINSFYQTGWKNLIDYAVISYYDKNRPKKENDDFTKVDELPFDFSRRRLSVIVERDNEHLMVTKGALEEMEDVYTHVEIGGEVVPLTEELQQGMREVSYHMNQRGMRTIAVAYQKNIHKSPVYSVADESNMILIGFVGFLDPAKKSAGPAIDSFHNHGVNVKVLTGDNAIVAKTVCEEVGITVDEYLNGAEIEEMSDAQLKEKVSEINLFAKLSPMQKSRIIQSLQENGHTVGFMGDGINDAPALRRADVGISVDTAADITKDASSIILLQKSLTVLAEGAIEGRKVFSNMMKYIRITISSNFGNVFSILVASIFLPFLPMLSLQLLVQNLVYDLAQLTTPWDHVDEVELEKPITWNLKSLVRFMLILGPVSSIFDILTFALMWTVFGANTVAQQGLFQAGWFVVGLFTQIFVVHILRTSKLSFIQSRASMALTIASVLACGTGLLIVGTSLNQYFDFLSLPSNYWPWLVVIVLGYILTTEIMKKIYIKVNNGWL
nr:magnesium-translocating P-type ATPase [Vagococcus elongatus]